MKVLILAQYFPPDLGGGATRAFNMGKGLSLVGCDVTVVTAFPHYPTGNIPKRYKNKLLVIENNGNLKIIRTFILPFASEGIAKRILLFASFMVSSLTALPIARKPDIVWSSNPNIIGMFPSVVYKFFNRCPAVQNVDDLWPDALYDLGMNDKSLIAKLSELIARITYSFASAITPISPAYVSTITDKYNVEPAKVCVVPAGVDLLMFSSKETKVTELSGKRFRVLYIGAFSPAYDFDQVLNAAKLLSDENDLEFVIQGGGELAASLASKVHGSSLKNVKVVNKIVSRQEVATIMDAADALVLPLNGIGSIELGISSKLYEYQAVGKPILCCSNGQPGLYISMTKSGIIVKPGDSEGLARAIMTLKNNPQLAREFGQNGRFYVENFGSIKVMGLKMKRLFESLSIPNLTSNS